MTDSNLQPHSLQMIGNNAIELDEKYLFARFEKGTRYYAVVLDKDLFDDWVITIANGRINTKLGRVRRIAFTCLDDALEKFENATKIRIKRGYQLSSHKTYQIQPRFYKQAAIPLPENAH